MSFAIDLTSFNRDSDTDLILFSLLCPSNVSVDILRVDNARDTLIQANKVKADLLKDLHGEEKRLIDDWCFLTLLSGTDYTPRLGGYDYRKVYALWRSLKSNPANSDRYIIKRQERAVADSSQVLIEGFVLNAPFFAHVLQGSNVPSSTHSSVQITSNGKSRTIRLSHSDWKCNWNTIQQALFKSVVLHMQRSSSSSLFKCRIYWTDTTGQRQLAGEGSGISARAAEYFACRAAVQPSSSLMAQVARAAMSEEDFQALSNAILAIAEPNDTSTSTSLPEQIDLSISPPGNPKLSQHHLLKMDDNPLLCEELLKGVFWTLPLFAGQIVNARYFYSYSLPPSVISMQRYLQAASQSSGTLRCAITDSASAATDAIITLSRSGFGSDALSPLEFFASAMFGNSANVWQVLSHTPRALLRGLDFPPISVLTGIGKQPSTPNFKSTIPPSLQVSIDDKRPQFRLHLEERSKAILMAPAEDYQHYEHSLAALSSCDSALLFVVDPTHQTPNNEEASYSSSSSLHPRPHVELEPSFVELLEARAPRRIKDYLGSQQHKQTICYAEQSTYHPTHNWRPFSTKRHFHRRSLGRRSFSSTVKGNQHAFRMISAKKLLLRLVK